MEAIFLANDHLQSTLEEQSQIKWKQFSWQMIICSPPSRNKAIRPYLSTTKMESMIDDKFMTPRITADKPKRYNLEENWSIKCHDVDAQELLNERNGEIHEEMRSVFPSHNVEGKGCFTLLEMSVASIKSSSSSWTSGVPRILCSTARAMPGLPSFDHTTGSVGKGKGTQRWDACQPQGETPPPGMDLGSAIVYQNRRKDSNAYE